MLPQGIQFLPFENLMAELTLLDSTVPKQMCIFAGVFPLDSLDKFLGDSNRRINALAGSVPGNCE